jgi:hypothetical protein
MMSSSRTSSEPPIEDDLERSADTSKPYRGVEGENYQPLHSPRLMKGGELREKLRKSGKR